eukprot:jgi/Tetstr1/438409/TSEL_026975.t1
MKKMNMRMALVAPTFGFGGPVRPMLPSTGTIGAVCANRACEDFPHFAETVGLLVRSINLHLVAMWHVLQGAAIYYLRDYKECDAAADDEDWQRVNESIKKQREEGFNCSLTYAQIGAAVRPGTSATPANWAACAEALDKYCQGTGTLEPEPAEKGAHYMGLNPYDNE